MRLDEQNLEIILSTKVFYELECMCCDSGWRLAGAALGRRGNIRTQLCTHLIEWEASLAFPPEFSGESYAKDLLSRVFGVTRKGKVTVYADGLVSEVC